MKCYEHLGCPTKRDFTIALIIWIGAAVGLVILLLFTAGCGSLTPKKPTIWEMEAYVSPEATVAPRVETGDNARIVQNLETIQTTLTQMQQGLNAIKQEVGSIGTQTIVSTDPAVIAEMRQVGTETVKAVQDGATARNRLDGRIVAAVIGLVIFLAFMPSPEIPAMWKYGGMGVGLGVVVASVLAML